MGGRKQGKGRRDQRIDQLLGVCREKRRMVERRELGIQQKKKKIFSYFLIP